MKKSSLSLLFMAIINIAFSQQILPDSIAVSYYFGGDYRDKKINGAYDNEDFSLLRYHKSEGYYSSKTVTHTRKIITWEKENINRDSSMLVYYNVEAKESIIIELLSLKDISLYEGFVWNADILIPLRTLEYPSVDTTYFLTDFSITDYNIDSVYFECFCTYYNAKFIEKYPDYNKQRKCNRFEEFSNWLRNRIQESSSNVSKSPYSQHIWIEFFYEEESLIFYQKYPGGLKTTWWIYTVKDGKKFNFNKINNPRINYLIAQLFPLNSFGEILLLEYQNKEAIFEDYFDDY